MAGAYVDVKNKNFPWIESDWGIREVQRHLLAPRKVVEDVGYAPCPEGPIVSINETPRRGVEPYQWIGVSRIRESEFGSRNEIGYRRFLSLWRGKCADPL